MSFCLHVHVCICMCCVVNRLFAGEPELGFDFQHSWSSDWLWDPLYILLCFLPEVKWSGPDIDHSSLSSAGIDKDRLYFPKKAKACNGLYS